ncbi:HmuY family protein [Sphingobacterium sp. Mn56C]|uniref:HmuY family protein n=1 Tax=Sphingobacterium sp. Mn56C TaxID=3395261 RepID=UPI003BBB2350
MNGRQQLGSKAKYLWVLFAICSITLSCSKSEAQLETEVAPTAPTTATVAYYKLHRVENLAAETDDKNPMARKTAVIYSLSYKQEQPLSYSKTAYWDISFSGLYNSFIGGNNGTDVNNRGYLGAGKGAVAIVEKAFDEVIDIPADSEFSSRDGKIGTDNYGDFGEGIGWYAYDFSGTLMSDGRYEKRHVAYTLSKPLVTVKNVHIPARTVIVKLANGDYAKIKMISCYKDAFNPEQWFLNTPHMFFTFEYVIVPAGSTKFEIK